MRIKNFILLLFVLLINMSLYGNKKIAVLFSEYSDEFFRQRGKNINRAVYGAKKVLKSLGLKYDIIKDTDIEDGVLLKNKDKLLICPKADALSSEERENIILFNKNGGAVIAAWDIGERDYMGRITSNDDIYRIFGIKSVGYKQDPVLGVGVIQQFMWYKFINREHSFFIKLTKDRAAAYMGEAVTVKVIDGTPVAMWMNRDKYTLFGGPAIVVRDKKPSGRTIFIGGYPFDAMFQKDRNAKDCKMILKNSVLWALGKNGGMKVAKFNWSKIKPKEKHKRGLWVWVTTRVLEPKETTKFFKFCKNRYIGTIYLDAESKTLFTFKKNRLKNFLRESHKRGFKVDAVDGWPRAALPSEHNKILEHVNWVIDYNKSVSKQERFDGIHHDIEPHSSPEWKTKRNFIIKGYLDITKKVYRLCHQNNLRYGIAMWATYDKHTGGKAVGKILWNGKKKYVCDHLIDFTDYTALMDYYDTPEKVIENAKYEIEYATKHNKKIIIGQETMDLLGEGIGTAGETYYEEGVIEMEKRIKRVYNYFKNKKGFYGMAVHCYRTYSILPDESRAKLRGKPPVVVISKRRNNIKINGDLSDWGKGGYKKIVIGKENNIVYGPNAWDGPDDLSSENYITYDKSALYFAFKIKDDVLMQKYKGVDIWRGDHIEMWIKTPTGKLFQFGYSPGNGENIKPEAYIWSPKDLKNKVVKISKIKLGFKKRNDGYNLEVKLPLSILGLKVKQGMKIKFTLDPSDTDDEDASQETLMSISPIWQKANSNTFSTLIFK